VAEQVTRLRREKIFSCAKHFPGLASAVGDPHFVVSSTEQPLTVFQARDWQPFRAAISAGVDLIMTTHLRAPALDPAHIATFSEEVISGRLRTTLGYSGIVISDDLQMLGALEGIDQVTAGTRALRVGHDLILFANLHDELENVGRGIAERVADNEALAQRIQESYHRVGSFKAEHASHFNL
jgi:beta-N-acetylhexosaminidase